MMPFKRIIAPTDLSEESFVGLRAATEIARKQGGELFVIHVICPDYREAVSLETSSTEEIQRSIAVHDRTAWKVAEDTMRDASARIVPEGILTHIVIEVGDPRTIISSMADSMNADLIVIATHGESGHRYESSGSVALEVVRTARVPVLTLHTQND